MRSCLVFIGSKPSSSNARITITKVDNCKRLISRSYSLRDSKPIAILRIWFSPLLTSSIATVSRPFIIAYRSVGHKLLLVGILNIHDETRQTMARPSLSLTRPRTVPGERVGGGPTGIWEGWCLGLS